MHTRFCIFFRWFGAWIFVGWVFVGFILLANIARPQEAIPIETNIAISMILATMGGTALGLVKALDMPQRHGAVVH